jgi:hypothetical protein
MSDKKHDDKQQPSSIGGDQISIGNVSGSIVSAGRNSSISVDASQKIEAAKIYEELFRRLEAIPNANPQDVADTKDEIETIRKVVESGEQIDESFLARRLRNIARMGSDILDVVTATFLNPALGLATAARKIVQKAREENGLDSSN